MYNFTKGRIPSVIKKLKFDEINPEFHRKVLILGSGESGYSFMSRAKWIWDFSSKDVGIFSAEPIHRVRFGQALYSLKHYEKIDIERPLLRDFKLNNLIFDEAVELFPEHSVISSFKGDIWTYDYLILACGRSIEIDRMPEFYELCEKETNDYYNMGTFRGYEKLRDNIDLISPDQEFNIIYEDDCDQLEEAISFAFLMRFKFPRASIRFTFGEKIIPFTKEIHEKLISLMSKRKILIQKGDIFEVLKKNEAIGLESKTLGDLTNRTVFIFPKKIGPQFLSQNSSLFPSNFNLNTLQNKTHPNIFGIGNFLFPNSSLSKKHNQADVVLQNLKQLMKKEWFSKDMPGREYSHASEVNFFEKFAKVVKITNGRFDRSFFKSKIRAYYIRNNLLFKHFYGTRLFPKQ